MLSQNLERPGGNLTGTTSFDPQQAKKQLDLLKEAIPGLRRVALLGDQGVSEALIKASEAEAQAMGLQNSKDQSGSARIRTWKERSLHSGKRTPMLC